MNEITVVIIDDHPLFRQGVADALSMDSRIRVIGQAAHGEVGLDMLLSLKPHPDSPAGPVSGLEVEVTPRPFNVLELRYRLAGSMAEIAFPPTPSIMESLIKRPSIRSGTTRGPDMA